MRYPDLGVILLYLAGVTWFGARFRTSQHTLKDYFLGGREAPWWAIGLSIVSAETSTLTILGTPALAFAGNFGFLQIVLGYLLARIVISFVLLPQYFRGQMFTAYELMQKRFGPSVRTVTAGTFLITRALAEGVRVFAVSIVISVILGTRELESIFLIVLLTLFYTFEGGMTAVIWTDVIQMGMYVLGAVVSFFVLLGKIDGGWDHAAAVAGAVHKFQAFDFTLSLHKPYTFLAGIIGGCFLTTASHGTDQLVVQRLLSAKSLAQSRAALLSSWIVVFVQFLLFLLIGALLYVYYGDNHLAPPKPLDRIYPEFIWNHLPTGLAGLAMAAILAAAMANLSAALNSLASTTVVDFLQPLFPGRSDAYYLWRARIATIGWALVLVAIGIIASNIGGSILEMGLSIASVTLGLLLGVFLLGCLTKRAATPSALIGIVTGLAAMLYVKFATTIAFTWWVAIGSVVTFGTGLLASYLVPPGEKGARRTNNG
jgi:SSS family solute:Na+ symporter